MAKGKVQGTNSKANTTKKTAKKKVVFNIVSQKGGCGKTAISLLIAKSCILLGKPCLLLDVDFTGTSLSDLLGIPHDDERLTLERILADGPFDEWPDSAAWLERLTKSALPIPLDAPTAVAPVDAASQADCIPSLTGPESWAKVEPFLAIEVESRYLADRTADLILTLRDTYDVFVLDNAPGISGLSKGYRDPRFRERLKSAFGSAPSRFRFVNLYLTACDRQDYEQTIKSYYDFYVKYKGSINGNWFRDNIIVANKYRQKTGLSFSRSYGERNPDMKKVVDFMIDEKVPFWFLEDDPSIRDAYRMENGWPGLGGFAASAKSGVVAGKSDFNLAGIYDELLKVLE